MCVEFRVDETFIESLGELRLLLGREPVYHEGTDASDSGDMCLCGVDAVETAKAMGRTVDWDDYGYLVFLTPEQTYEKDGK